MPTSANLRIAWTYWVAARDLEQLDGLAKTLIALDDAHGWYLDTADLATGHAGGHRAPSPASAERVNQEIALRIDPRPGADGDEGVHARRSRRLRRRPRAASSGAPTSDCNSRSCAGSPACTCSVPSSTSPPRSAARSSPSARPSTNRAMLIDGHLLVGHDAHERRRPRRRARALRSGDRAVPGAADRDPNGAGRHRSTGRQPDDVRIHPVAAGPAGSSGRTSGCRARPRGSARPPVHVGVRALPRGRPSTLAPRVAIALELATALIDLADEHEFRIWTATGSVLLGAARVELGGVDAGMAEIEGGIGLYGELRSPPIFWPFLLFVQAQALAQRRATGRRAPGARRRPAHPRPGSGASILPELHVLGAISCGPGGRRGGRAPRTPSRGTGRRSSGATELGAAMVRASRGDPARRPSGRGRRPRWSRRRSSARSSPSSPRASTPPTSARRASSWRPSDRGEIGRRSGATAVHRPVDRRRVPPAGSSCDGRASRAAEAEVVRARSGA